MDEFEIRLESLNRANELLKDLGQVWGASSAETRRLAAHRTKCEAEAKALEELANALTVANKAPEDLARSISFLRHAAPNVDTSQLDEKLDSAIEEFENDLLQALMDDDPVKVTAASLSLEKCDRGDLVEELFGQIRMWQVASFEDWAAEARNERAFAARTMPSIARANAAFEKAAMASLNDLAGFLKDDDPKKRATKIKALSDALPDLKESCGSSTTAKAAWDSVLNVMKTQLRVDLEKILKEQMPAKWSTEFHGVDQAALEAFGLLSRAGAASDPPPTVISHLLDRVRDANKGKENDIFVLLGSCNTLDYILGYLDDYTPERSRAAAMLRSAKDGVVKRACAELEKHGASFVKQSGRYFQVQNPVLRTELRLEVAKAWKTTRSREVSATRDGADGGDVNAAVALFFEGPPKQNE